MKRLSTIFFLCAMALFSTPVFADEAKIKQDVSKAISESMAQRGQKVNVSVDVIKKFDAPQGYYYIKVTFFKKEEPTKPAGQQYLFTDGKYIVTDFIDINGMSSLEKEMLYDLSNVSVDVKDLTPVIGKPGAKNVLVEIIDFQCSFCSQMNTYLHQKLKNNKNVVLYVMHFPLTTIHPRAEILAKIFEAGTMLNKNFLTSLYDGANGTMSDDDLIEKYAKLSGNAAQFKRLVKSDEVAKKIANSTAQAKKLGMESTPALVVNGKMIVGFDRGFIDKALSSIK